MLTVRNAGIALLLVVAADLAVTALALALVDGLAEGNPLVADGMRLGGVGLTVGAIMFGTTATVQAGAWVVERSGSVLVQWSATCALIVLAFVRAAITLANLVLILSTA